MAENDEKLAVVGSALPPGALWAPVTGATTDELRSTLLSEGEVDASSFVEVQRSALSILGRTAPPTGSVARRTGLVVGYVQSGKTLSMTTVAAVARDNGFRIVIVFSGVTSLLLTQSRDRFQQHLQPPGQFQTHWRMLDSADPAALRRSNGELAGLLAVWRNPSLPDHRKPALFITVMKNYRHLDALAALLRSANLTGVPALIIDDEADQAGLNTKPSATGASSTHRHIAAVRAQLPHHTYLQYTATPQAPLLISLIDMLSPEFAAVLDPGVAYRGGQAFFGPSSPQLAQSLGPAELFTPGQPPSDPPPGFERSLAEFVVAVAADYCQRRKPPRSMLVHPSPRKADHDLYFRWSQAILSEWSRELQLPVSDPDRQALVAELQEAYDELARTDGGLPSFADVLAELMIQVGQVVITELNSETGDEVKWQNGYAHLLVGGEKLNRGFTVKGLTITYMPRGAGGWNADTIQQRARFFGYKGSYINRCRVYLHPDVRQAYQNYVEHEENVRRQLVDWGARSLKDWKRAFFLDGAMRPTRGSVLSDPYYRVRGADSWHIQNSPHDDVVRDSNLLIGRTFLSSLQLQPFVGSGRHTSAIVSLDLAQRELLVPWAVVGPNDVRHLYAVRVWVDAALQQDPAAEACIVLMSGGLPSSDHVRGRGAEGGVVKQLMSGRGGDQLGAYEGDREMFDPDRVTIQIHRLHVNEGGKTSPESIAIAVRMPQAMSGVLVQPQP